METKRIFIGVLVICMLGSCTQWVEPGLTTPIPTEHLPTVIAQTLLAKGVKLSTPTSSTPGNNGTRAPTNIEPGSSVTPKTSSNASATAKPTRTPTNTRTPTRTRTPTPTPTHTSSPTVTATFTPTFTATPTFDLTQTAVILALTPSSTATPFPPVPEARVQIYRLGELSLVTSPIQVTARLTSQFGKVVRVELHGEDGRLLARQVKVFNTLPWHVASISVELDYEISAAAEVGRLIISAEDVYGRIIDLNSVNLVLLSTGVTELNPASALLESIFIQEPINKALIQGGLAYVSGLARPNGSLPLRIALITEDGKTVGQRLAAVKIPIPGGYGTFAAEVPYTVTSITPALLVVYEEGQPISEMTHLSSLEVILSP
jgi:hypothetical protein